MCDKNITIREDGRGGHEILIKINDELIETESITLSDLKHLVIKMQDTCIQIHNYIRENS